MLRGPDAGPWGSLPSYLGFLRLRGGTVDVPERYRRLYEAFLRNSSRQEQRAAPRADRRPGADGAAAGGAGERR